MFQKNIYEGDESRGEVLLRTLDELLEWNVDAVRSPLSRVAMNAIKKRSEEKEIRADLQEDLKEG